MTLVAVDIGGTNVRFAMVQDDGELTGHRSMLCGDFPSFEAAMQAYAAALEIVPSAASIAVAGPVQGDLVEVTNNHWSFSKTGLVAALGLNQLQIINDFTAQALAQADPSAHGNMLLIDGDGTEQAPLLVIGPGTGLGVSALVPAGGNYLPLEGEGGHVGLSPQSAAELAVFTALQQGVPHVSAEHFISGSGLETIYRLQNDGAAMAAPQIGAGAVAGPGPERDAANMMLGLLGSVVADAVLTMGCWRGVVIAGGIVAQLQPLVADSPFQARFRHDGMMSPLLQQIPVWLSFDPHAGLRGAAAGLPIRIWQTGSFALTSRRLRYKTRQGQHQKTQQNGSD